MTSVGHTLTGLSLAAAGTPFGVARQRRAMVFVACALLANFPDLPVPGWGHDAYDVSHSLFVNGLGIFVLTLLALQWQPMRTRLAGPRGVLLVAAAWASHVLLDSMYNHGQGVAALWPLSDGRIAMPLPWFSTLRPDPLLSRHNLQVFGIELLAYGSLLLAVVVLRHLARPRVAPAASSRD